MKLILFTFLFCLAWGGTVMAEELYIVQWGVPESIVCENAVKGDTILSVACMKPPRVEYFLTKESAIKAVIGNNPRAVYRLICTFGYGKPQCVFEEMEVIETKDFKSK